MWMDLAMTDYLMHNVSPQSLIDLDRAWKRDGSGDFTAREGDRDRLIIVRSQY